MKNERSHDHLEMGASTFNYYLFFFSYCYCSYCPLAIIFPQCIAVQINNYEWIYAAFYHAQRPKKSLCLMIRNDRCMYAEWCWHVQHKIIFHFFSVAKLTRVCYNNFLVASDTWIYLNRSLHYYYLSVSPSNYASLSDSFRACNLLLWPLLKEH